MELAYTSNFIELTFDEAMLIDGGINWDSVGEYIATAGGSAIGSAIGGAKKGAIFGPKGAAVGAVIGGLAGLILYTLWD